MNAKPLRPRPLALRPLAVLVLLGVLDGGAACRKNGATPGVAAVTVPANPRLLLRGIIPCLDATVARVDDLHAAGAPFGGSQLRTMLLARLNLPESTLQTVDTSKAI